MQQTSPSTFYTDGSANDQHDGGAAEVITTSSADQPTLTETLQQRGRPLASSCEEEKDAMLMPAEWIAQNSRQGGTIICADSQSLLKAT